MIELTSGNLLRAPTQALVNTVNTEGVMGKGIAYQFKEAHPKMYQAYADACKLGELEVGQMHVYRLGELVDGPQFIINFPTKRHWRQKSRLEDIRSGLEALVKTVRELNIKSIAIPPLGCGNGGLDWNVVRPMVVEAFSSLPDVRALIYEPKGAPPAKEMQRSSSEPQMTAGRAVLVALMDRYLKGLLDPFITLLEVQKLMYFMQEAGEPLKLDYSKGTYGPYASNLRFQLSRMEGHFISGFGDAEEKPGKVLELLDDAVEQATKFLVPHEDTSKRMDRVAYLIKGFEDSFGMELLATVHWVLVTNERARTDLDEVIRDVHGWNPRKRKLMSPEQIEAAWQKLAQGDWHFLSSSIH